MTNDKSTELTWMSFKEENNSGKHPPEANGQLQNKNTVADGVRSDGGNGISDDANGFSFLRLSFRKKMTFLLLGFSNLAACTCFGLLAPFFPKEDGVFIWLTIFVQFSVLNSSRTDCVQAAAKDMSQTVTGLVFSCFDLWIFVSSPVFGNYITKIGPRFAFLGGQFLAGSSFICFGTLYMCPPGATFIALSFLLRTIAALGTSAFVTASFALIANEFPDNVATVFGSLQMFSGLGYASGPVVGGALYDAGGFGMPFYVMGSFLLLCVAATFCLMPARNDGPPRKRKGSIVRLFASPLVIVACITIVFGSYCFGSMDATLANHLGQFHLSAFLVGVLFMINAAVYSVSSPVCGWLSDRKGITYPVLLTGNFLNCVGLLLMGPSPLLPFLSTNLWLIIVGLVLLGIGTGASIVPALRLFYTGARRLGFKDGLDLDGLVSGLLNSSSRCGSFLGPIIGSAVVQAANYKWSTTVNAGFSLFAALCLIIYVTVEKSCLKYNDYKTFDDVSQDDVKQETSWLRQSSKDTKDDVKNYTSFHQQDERYF